MSAKTRHTTRRAVVAGLAVAPVAALPTFADASPAPADPIFDAFAEFERMRASELATWKASLPRPRATSLDVRFRDPRAQPTPPHIPNRTLVRARGEFPISDA